MRNASHAALLILALGLAASGQAPQATDNRYLGNMSSGSYASATAAVGEEAEPVRRTAKAAAALAAALLAAGAVVYLFRHPRRASLDGR